MVKKLSIKNIYVNKIYKYIIRERKVINMEILEIKGTEQFDKEVLKSEQTVFVDFFATWCMPCKMMAGVIDKMAEEYTNVKFAKIDVDQNQQLSEKYNVMSIPTMMVFKKGMATKTFIGVTDKDEIAKEF